MLIHAEHLDMGAEGCLALAPMTTHSEPAVSGTTDDPLSPRERAIRAIHNYANWLTAHPDVPAPRHVYGTHYLPAEGSEAERVQTILDWARDADARLTETTSAVSASLVVVWEKGVIMVDHMYGAYLDPPELRQRYVPVAGMRRDA